MEADYDLEWKVNGVSQTDWCILVKQETIVKRYQPVDYPSLKLKKKREYNRLFNLFKF